MDPHNDFDKHDIPPANLRATFTNEVIRAISALARQQNVCREQSGQTVFVTGMEAAREYIVEHVQSAVVSLGEAAPSGWQPIETAPKDGTVLLGWSPMWAVGLPETMIWLNGNRIGWHTYAGHHMFVKQPTHWQPLPPPPTPGA